MKQKFFCWLPRILSILFIMFLSLFALDVFGEGYGFLETLIALFMHLIPTFVILILTMIAWKWSKTGGIIFIIAGIFFTFYFNTFKSMITFLVVSGPVFLIGILFYISSNIKKKKKKITLTIKSRSIKKKAKKKAKRKTKKK